MNISENMKMSEALVTEYIIGHKGSHKSQEHKKVANDFKKFSKNGLFSSYSTQKCENMFMNIHFRGKFLEWKDHKNVDDTIFGNFEHKTDFGICCYFVPHLYFQESIDNKNASIGDRYHRLKADALSGKKHGLDILLNAEQFNYADPQSNSVGFQIALHNHRDKPIMQFSSDLLHPGTETQINLKPTLTKTTDDAISRFSPKNRDCYSDGEGQLTHITYQEGYRYEMNNCFVDEKIKEIIWSCRCRPVVWEKCLSCGSDDHYYNAMKTLPLCTGRRLYCSNERMKFIGLEKMPESEDTILPEATKSPKLIGNVTKPQSIPCLPGCVVQHNNKLLSHSLYPQKTIFAYKKPFCIVASHVLFKTCLQQNRRILLNEQHPNLCPILEVFNESFVQCEKWPEIFIESYGYPINKTLVEEMYQYERNNIALVHVMIQSPFITTFKRDVAMTFLSYVANTGGLLGLFIGFSCISGIEILFWSCCCCNFKFKKNVELVAPVEEAVDVEN